MGGHGVEESGKDGGRSQVRGGNRTTGQGVEGKKQVGLGRTVVTVKEGPWRKVESVLGKTEGDRPQMWGQSLPSIRVVTAECNHVTDVEWFPGTSVTE